MDKKILLVYGITGKFHVFRNKCTHMGRRLDPIVGRAVVRCCSVFRSTFDYAGNVMSGVAKESLRTYRVENEKCKVIIRLG